VKLTPRLTLTFVLYAAALLAGVGLLAYTSGRESLRSAVLSELQATAIEKQAALNAWVEEKQADIIRLAAAPAVIESAAAVLAASPDSPEARDAHDRLLAEIRPRVLGGEFQDLMIIEPQTGALIRAGDQFAISATFFNMQLDWRLFIVLTRLESNEGVILPESMTITEDGATGVMTVEAALATPGTYSVGVYIATSKKEVQRLQRWAESNEPVTADTEYDGVILFRDLAVFGVE